MFQPIYQDNFALLGPISIGKSLRNSWSYCSLLHEIKWRDAYSRVTSSRYLSRHEKCNTIVVNSAKRQTVEDEHHVLYAGYDVWLNQ